MIQKPLHKRLSSISLLVGRVALLLAAFYASGLFWSTHSSWSFLLAGLGGFLLGRFRLWLKQY